ncbi:dihydrolipoamide acetyltransferase family protein [Ornithinimicrobium pekingense]|uniref:Dihydrolipoamide acetyltransferase component of pyruvate dehydrogenase complex n=1 Tax=Ornithinimicrobium pekingense TaxID=384677 RepID=A0ABQ2F9E9_9MICO|nr:dihydrolipoamide acetyltransferase family protein [Ornithinimicrobium pekingense]GGK71609.1 dihydrolipoamide acetyltransferase component of pyruvate dehydrogenase complex [Ornithinimicrobium pekingense]
MSATDQVFRLPDLGEGLTEAEIVSWHVAVGDEVGVDQEVVTVETAKAAVDVPCPFAGAVAELHAEPGTVLEVGAPLITIAGGDGAGMPVNGASSAGAGAAGEQYREEERAGAKAADDSPERPLIGYGAGDGPARRSGGRRRRTATTTPTNPTAPLSPPTTSGARETTPPTTSGARTGRAVRVISPLVRRLAQEWGIDLTTVTPGPTGVIRRKDLEAARDRAPDVVGRGEKRAPDVPGRGEKRAPDVPGRGEKRAHDVPGQAKGLREERVPIQGVQRLMVERLSTSRREIPDATTWVDVDATRLMKAKDRLKAARPDAGIGVLPLLARIAVAGLTAYPALNSSVDLDAGEIVRHGAVNLGFAAQSPRGLVVPVVHGAQAMTTAELAAALRELTERAREGRLSPAELTGGTFTLNNYGVFGVDGSTPIINHPEAAMLGVGRIVDKPWVHKGRLKVRKVTQLSFTFDHRVCDGGTAGGFLRFVADCVEDPGVLLADL